MLEESKKQNEPCKKNVESRGEHGGLRRSRSALGRFLFWFLGAWQVAVAERAAAASTRMCAPQLVGPEAVWRTAGAVWWHRATLELRRTCRSVARIPLRGNSGNGSCSSRTCGAATKKWRLGEQPKENPEKGARKKTVRVAMEVTTRQVENGTGEGREGTRSPPPRPGEDQTDPVLVQTPNDNPSEVQDFAPKLAVLELPQAASVISPLLSSSLEAFILSIS
ncbi:hypothetical protein NDU88_006282 [Pleurodeles waltl]|uniref:Uncharacterized protein n=1 Tax=Pleurodeles waltl TaxID=8319 RepID=A0AAV7TXU7_PLEWA|nr:hypothetical protein NDU88_006282 [Pleurodeles waltl]